MKKWWGISLSIVVLVTAYFCYCLIRPVSISIPDFAVTPPTVKSLPIKQLNTGRSAIGYIDPISQEINCRPLGEGDDYTVPQPTASLAKTITVQVVLAKYPLKQGENGPLITMSADDEARYWKVVNEGGSSARVVAGEQISEKQLVEGIMMVSANNMADSLAIWAFGSLDNYRVAATQWLKDNKLNSTVIGSDASGFSPDTKSTPTDLCRIMLLATKNRALSDIMSTADASLPTGEQLHNTNRLLGQEGVFAGKTGYTDEAGRGVIMASHKKIGNSTITMGLATLGHASYDEAFNSARLIVSNLTSNINIYQIDKDKKLGQISSSWGSVSDIVTNKSLAVPYWVDQPPKVDTSIHIDKTDGLSAQQIIGQIRINDDAVGVISAQSIESPSVWWRLSHPW